LEGETPEKKSKRTKKRGKKITTVANLKKNIRQCFEKEKEIIRELRVSSQ
jgi:hypothetical protein